MSPFPNYNLNLESMLWEGDHPQMWTFNGHSLELPEQAAYINRKKLD